MIIYNISQYYCDECCSPESWRSLLLKMAETMKEHMHSANSSKNTVNALFKRRKTHQMFSDVLSCTDTKTQG